VVFSTKRRKKSKNWLRIKGTIHKTKIKKGRERTGTVRKNKNGGTKKARVRGTEEYNTTGGPRRRTGGTGKKLREAGKCAIR